MILVSPQHRMPLRWWPGLLCLCFVAGCGRNDIRVYTVPKEKEPGIPWNLPAGWEQREAGGMRAGRFAVPNTNGHEADVSIIPLKEISASRADVVNLWREQLRLPRIEEDALAQIGEKLTINSEKGELFDMASDEPLIDNKTKARMLLAVVKAGNTTWFIKMTGEDEHVRQQKSIFVEFLKSLDFDAINTQPSPPPRFTSTNVKEVPHEGSEEKPVWVVPPGWQEQPPSQMLLAKFLITGEDGARADVNVSALTGAGGGVLDNINRWRGQIGLPPTQPDELEKLITSLDLPNGKVILVDMNGTDARTGQPARVIGAIVPREGKTWFYKLMGNEQVAAREKDAFIKFLQTVKYPNG